MDHDTREMLLDTAGRFFAERCGKDIVNRVEKGVWPADFWKEIEEMGLPLTAVPE
ncbi:MAG: acyl-CoA dehydrogenase, partial [Rhodospirillales bacterium]|nr:acyl-CoA dehydrogenase [Rhodospirillales bacterium]